MLAFRVHEKFHKSFFKTIQSLIASSISFNVIIIVKSGPGCSKYD